LAWNQKVFLLSDFSPPQPKITPCYVRQICCSFPPPPPQRLRAPSFVSLAFSMGPLLLVFVEPPPPSFPYTPHGGVITFNAPSSPAQLSRLRAPSWIRRVVPFQFSCSFFSRRLTISSLFVPPNPPLPGAPGLFGCFAFHGPPPPFSPRPLALLSVFYAYKECPPVPKVTPPKTLGNLVPRTPRLPPTTLVVEPPLPPLVGLQLSPSFLPLSFVLSNLQPAIFH